MSGFKVKIKIGSRSGGAQESGQSGAASGSKASAGSKRKTISDATTVGTDDGNPAKRERRKAANKSLQSLKYLDDEFELGEEYLPSDPDDVEAYVSRAKSGKGGRGGNKKRRGGGAADRDYVDDGELSDEYEEVVVEPGDYYVLGQQDEVFKDYSSLPLKEDYANRPLYVCPDGRIFLETYSPVYKQAYDFLIAVAEPVCRPECVHEYCLTPHSLYAAVSVGLETPTIIDVLNRLSKVALSADLIKFIKASTENYGKVKIVLHRNKFYVESPFPEILERLLRDDVIRKARADPGGGFLVRKALRERGADDLKGVADIDLAAAAEQAAAAEAAAAAGEKQVGEGDDVAEEDEDPDRTADEEALREVLGEPMPSATRRPAVAASTSGAGGGPTAAAAGAGRGGDPAAGGTAAAAAAAAAGVPVPGGVVGGAGGAAGGEQHMEEDPGRVTHAFEVKPEEVEHVKARCLPNALNYPMLEEYDFMNDTANADLNIELKPNAKHRPYQAKSLAKMFGNGRARSGIIVLPCGAGKSLVGVSAAARVKKSCLVLVTNTVSVDQWRWQFKHWSSLQDEQITSFTSDTKELIKGCANVCITTYTMIAFSGRRSEYSQKIMDQIMSREWGLLLMDEVHVVPAQMFRKVLGIVKAHCKLGLTATLVREDALISDLNFLIGPKLYEANWLDLTRAGHIANVQCVEVWCPMTRDFYKSYLDKANASRRQLLYVMNPNKFQSCEFLIDFHERLRGDKVIVFSDNIFALREYAFRLRKPFIYGQTSHVERTRILEAFKNPTGPVNTIFLSKIGDTSIDIPEANVLIQISSHAGSRRQEAQRLGRILRAKKAKPGAGGTDEYNAFFYTLVSKDTMEMYYSQKRQQFLIDQGYSFEVITNLLDRAGSQGLGMSSHEEQLDVLAKVLAAGEVEMPDEEGLPDDTDDLAKRKAAARRRAGSMAALSGASGLTYLEYSTKAGGGRGRGRGGGAAKKKAGPSLLKRFK